MSKKKSTSADFNPKTCIRLFEKYKDEDEDCIEVEGIERFCEDISVDPMDSVMLVLAWKLHCANVCQITRDEWIEGWSVLGCDSLDKIKTQIPLMKHCLEDPAQFKAIYLFTFNFAKKDNSRSLQLDLAIGYWKLMFSSKFKYLDLWIDYMQQYYKKAVSKDTWNLFIDFTETVKNVQDLKAHDLMGAWPVVIDNFVEWLLENKKQCL